MTKGNATEPGPREKGVLGVAAAGWRGGWWTGAVFGSVWLAVIGVHSSRSPAVMADRMTLSAFSLPSVMCVCVWVCGSGCVEAHTFRGLTTGDRDTDNDLRGCVSGQPRGKCYAKWM